MVVGQWGHGVLDLWIDKVMQQGEKRKMPGKLEVITE
jgi:hypothetical protein